MTERQEHIHNFLVALQMLCQTYNVAILNADEEGMHVVPFPVNVKKTPGLFGVGSITPNGVTGITDVDPPTWEEDGHL